MDGRQLYNCLLPSAVSVRVCSPNCELELAEIIVSRSLGACFVQISDERVGFPLMRWTHRVGLFNDATLPTFQPPPKARYSAMTSVVTLVWLWTAWSSSAYSSRCASNTDKKSTRPALYCSAARSTANWLCCAAWFSRSRLSCSCE